MKKKLVILNTSLIIGLSSAFAIPSVDAASIHSQKQELQKERSGIQSNLSEADQELSAVLEELVTLQAQMDRVNQGIADNNKLVAKTEKDIIRTKAEVEQLKIELAEIQERIDKRNEILKERAVTYQQNGNSPLGYIEVLLGSTSFGDFIERVGAVSKIVEADQDILAQHDADKKTLEEKKQTIEKKLSDLENMKTELEGMRSLMEEQKQNNIALENELKQKEKEIIALKDNLKIKDSELASKQIEIQNRMKVSGKVPASQNSSSPSDSKPSAGNKGSNNNNKNNNNNIDKPTNENNIPAKGNVNTVINAGYKYIGNSVYVFGGGRTQSDIANGRFDCSGFVSWAYSQAGVSLPAYTESLKNVGRQVSSSDMKPGDLVFFDTYKKDGHVGIYMGGGKFIGSQSSTGVAIANMSSGYWKDKFNGRVVRIF